MARTAKKKRRYSTSSGRAVKDEMRRYKKGTAKSGRGGKVNSRKQAIAIGLRRPQERQNGPEEEILKRIERLFGLPRPGPRGGARLLSRKVEAHNSRRADRHEAADEGFGRPFDRPGYCPASAVGLGDDGLIRHHDPSTFEADAIVAVPGCPIRNPQLRSGL